MSREPRDKTGPAVAHEPQAPPCKGAGGGDVRVKPASSGGASTSPDPRCGMEHCRRPMNSAGLCTVCDPKETEAALDEAKTGPAEGRLTVGSGSDPGVGGASTSPDPRQLAEEIVERGVGAWTTQKEVILARELLSALDALDEARKERDDALGAFHASCGETNRIEAQRNRLATTGQELLARLHFVPNLPATVEQAAEAFFAALASMEGDK